MKHAQYAKSIHIFFCKEEQRIKDFEFKNFISIQAGYGSSHPR